MANHISSEKRARQAPKRTARNSAIKSSVRTAEREVRASLSDPAKAEAALRRAFSVIQKSRGVVSKNAIKRKMARLAKAVALKTKA